MLESRARLRHAADLAKLTYFDFDHARGRMESADNFASIMGFALPPVSDGADAIAEGEGGCCKTMSRRATATAFAAETEALEAGRVRKIEYRVVGDDGESVGSRASGI